jgi:hypothetical protein
MTGCGAVAAPLRLATDAEITDFAERIKAYAGVSRLRWVVAAPTLLQAANIVAAVKQHLAAPDRNLTASVRIEALPPGPENAPVAWVEPRIGQDAEEATCSWQVWVSDPDLPSGSKSPAPLPLAPGDKVPVGPAATFRVGFTGLVQSQLYALGETRAGEIRDLAQVPDVNIPISPREGTELLVLVRARHPVSFFESVRAALDKTGGIRRNLGQAFGLRATVLGPRRGIGANVQLVDPGMIVRGMEGAEPGPARAVAPAQDAVAETCLFSLIPTGG